MKKALEENTEQLNRVYENNLPNKKTSNINIAPTTSSSSANGIYVIVHKKKMDYYNNKEKASLDALWSVLSILALNYGH